MSTVDPVESEQPVGRAVAGVEVMLDHFSCSSSRVVIGVQLSGCHDILSNNVLGQVLQLSQKQMRKASQTQRKGVIKRQVWNENRSWKRAELLKDFDHQVSAGVSLDKRSRQTQWEQSFRKREERKEKKSRLVIYSCLFFCRKVLTVQC